VYEHRGRRPITRREFARRLLQHLGIAALLVLVSLALGMAGYMGWERLPWRDAFLNAAMLLGGMGPVNRITTDAGKLFAGLYALYAGLVFLIVAGLFLAPLFHRILHRFHWEEREGGE
jgi:hypothetical protein